MQKLLEMEQDRKDQQVTTVLMVSTEQMQMAEQTLRCLRGRHPLGDDGDGGGYGADSDDGADREVDQARGDSDDGSDG